MRELSFTVTVVFEIVQFARDLAELHTSAFCGSGPPHSWVTKSTSHVISKAVTRGVFWVFEHPPKFQGKIRHTKTDLLLVTKFSKVTTG